MLTEVPEDWEPVPRVHTVTASQMLSRREYELLVYGTAAKIMRVMVEGREYERRTKLRWIANDFRLGTFRTRADAVRAARRAGYVNTR